MSNNMTKMFLLVISFAGGMLVAAEKQQVGKVRKISDSVTVRSAGPAISFCENPGKHKAIVTNKQGYTARVEGPFPMPEKQGDMWTVFITASLDKESSFFDFGKGIHSVQWIQKDDWRVTFCDNTFCFLRI